jgi:peptidyl-Lys metalloendopeptidase
MRNAAMTTIRVPLGVSVALASVWLGGAAAAAPPAEPHATYVGCTAAEQTQVLNAADVAQRMAAGAEAYVRTHTSATPRYTTWFGAYTPARHSTVVSHFRAISQTQFGALSYDCATCQDAGVGYVNPDQADRVFLCKDFWQAPLTGTDSEAGALVNLVGRFTKNGGLKDSVQGQAGCQGLARDNPAAAVNNAASHQYFAENNPPLA